MLIPIIRRPPWPSDSIEHRSLQSLGGEEPGLASGEGEGESSQFSGSSPEEEREMAVSLAETRQYLVLCDNSLLYSTVYSFCLLQPGLLLPHMEEQERGQSGSG